MNHPGLLESCELVAMLLLFLAIWFGLEHRDFPPQDPTAGSGDDAGAGDRPPDPAPAEPAMGDREGRITTEAELLREEARRLGLLPVLAIPDRGSAREQRLALRLARRRVKRANRIAREGANRLTAA